MKKDNIGKLNFNDLISLSNKLNKINKFAVPRDVPEYLTETIEKAESIKVNIPDSKGAEKINYTQLIDKIGEDLVNKVTMTPVELDKVPNFPSQKSGMKPEGLWYACGNDWIQWVSGEMPEWIGRYIYSLKINEDKMLMIESAEQFKDFEEKYAGRGRGGARLNWKPVAEGDRARGLKPYGGIEICPAQYESQAISWYSSWDVASGCIWDPSIITEATLIARQINKVDRSDYEPDYEDYWDQGPRDYEEPNWEWYGFGGGPAASGDKTKLEQEQDRLAERFTESIESGRGQPSWDQPWGGDSIHFDKNTMTSKPYDPQSKPLMNFNPQTGEPIVGSKFATFVKILNAQSGRRAVYRMEPPLPGRHGGGHEYIVVSNNTMETYIFASDANGVISDYMDLPGSSSEPISHEAVLNNIGYNLK